MNFFVCLCGDAEGLEVTQYIALFDNIIQRGRIAKFLAIVSHELDTDVAYFSLSINILGGFSNGDPLSTCGQVGYFKYSKHFSCHFSFTWPGA